MAGTNSNGQQQYDLIVIGGGTVGLTAVAEALELGCPSVALIEKEEIGGECAHFACVPTKTLLTAARDLKLMREHAPQYGIHTDNIRFDFQELMKKKNEIVYEGGYDLLADPRLTLIRGTARFIAEDAVEVNGQTLHGERFMITTGSRASVPEIDGLPAGQCLTYREAVQLKAVPDSMVILGGGAVGVEFSQAFTTFGSRVTIIEHNDRLLTGEEPEISQKLTESLQRDGVRIITNASVERVVKPNGHMLVMVRQGQKAFQETIGVEAQVILCATGTRPNIEGLDLEVAGVDYTGKGIRVNDEMRTSNPRIWAAGDVTAGYKFTHVGDYEAEIAVQNALMPDRHLTPDCRSMAWAIFTEPTVAHVGLTEAQAREQFPNITVLMANVSEVSRYRIESAKDGFIKLIVNADNHELLGGHILAPEADDLAHVLITAIHNRLKVSDLVPMLYIYPAKAQLIQKALEKYEHRPRLREPVGAR